MRVNSARNDAGAIAITPAFGWSMSGNQAFVSGNRAKVSSRSRKARNWSRRAASATFNSRAPAGSGVPAGHGCECRAGDDGLAVGDDEHVADVRQARDFGRSRVGNSTRIKAPGAITPVRCCAESTRARPPMPGARHIPRPSHLQANDVLRADARRSALRHVHRNDAVGFLTAGEIAQKGGLDIVGERAVLGIGDGLQPAHALRIEAQRDGDLGGRLGRGPGGAARRGRGFANLRHGVNLMRFASKCKQGHRGVAVLACVLGCGWLGKNNR